MENLQKEITGRWFDLKSVMEHPVELLDYFDFTQMEIESVIEVIYLAVEEGILEYKNNIIKAVFTLTNSLKYDAASLNKLKSITLSLKTLTYIILLQRLIAKKTVKLKHRISDTEKEEEKNDSPRFSIADIGNIIKEVQELIAKDPQVKTDKNVINILIQVRKYRAENDSMKKLINNIPKDKLENFKANYSQKINSILASLINSYNQFLKEKEGEPEQKHSNPLELYDLSITSELLKKQAEEVSAVRSTLEYAEKERFRTRDILMTLDSRIEKIKEMFEEEKKKYFNISLSEQGSRELSRYLSLEIIENLKKELDSL